MMKPARTINGNRSKRARRIHAARARTRRRTVCDARHADRCARRSPLRLRHRRDLGCAALHHSRLPSRPRRAGVRRRCRDARSAHRRAARRGGGGCGRTTADEHRRRHDVHPRLARVRGRAGRRHPDRRALRDRYRDRPLVRRGAALHRGAGAGAATVFGMLPMPESPRWLMKHGRAAEAGAALRRVRQEEKVDAELQQIAADIAQDRPAAWRNLSAPELRPALLVGIGLAVFQQVTGINTIIYYAPQIFEAVGFGSATTALAATIGIGIVNVLATVVAIALVDHWGRRPLLLAGLTGMIISLLALGLASHEGTSTGWLGATTVACIGIYIVCFAFSLGPIVWLMISEIFPNRIRARAASVSTAAN